MSRFGRALPPRAARGEVSAQRTEGSCRGVGSIEASVHFRSPQCLTNGFAYDLGSNQHVIVPEAQHPKTARPEKHISTHVVVGLLSMLAPVQLDDDRSLKTREVADIWSDRVLSAEFEPCQLASAQTLPQHALCVSRVLTKSAREAKHAPTEPPLAGISVANYNPCELRPMTPPALRATSPAKLGRQAVVAP